MKTQHSTVEAQRISDQLGLDHFTEIDPVFTCVDQTVSRETFELVKYKPWEMLVTLPQPTEQDLPAYYDSQDYISHTDGRRNFMERIYQVVKTISLRKKLKLLNKHRPSKGRLLDIGCGTGDFLKVCQEDGWQICGIEPNEKARLNAQQKAGGSSIILQDLQELMISNEEKFDFISLWHVLEHMPDLMESISNIKSLLKPEGIILVAVPNFKSYDAAHYGSHWAAYDVPRHLWHFSRESIERIFSIVDMNVIQERPLVFDSFYVSLLSEKYATGKQNFISAFYQGLRSNLAASKSGEYSSIIYLIQ